MRIFVYCQNEVFRLIDDTRRSYWTWAFLGFLIVVIQFLGISEKLWIKVCTSALAIFEPALTFDW